MGDVVISVQILGETRIGANGESRLLRDTGISSMLSGLHFSTCSAKFNTVSHFLPAPGGEVKID